MNAVVYIVDDHPAVLESLSLLCEAHGLPAECFASAEDFLEALDPSRPGCVVLDIQLSGLSGLELLAELQRRGIGLPVIFLSARRVPPFPEGGSGAGVIDFLVKPVSSTILLERIRTALDISHENKS